MRDSETRFLQADIENDQHAVAAWRSLQGRKVKTLVDDAFDAMMERYPAAEDAVRHKISQEVNREKAAAELRVRREIYSRLKEERERRNWLSLDSWRKWLSPDSLKWGVIIKTCSIRNRTGIEFPFRLACRLWPRETSSEF